MVVNGYRIGDAPTKEEIEVFERVKHYYNAEWIAGWLGTGEISQRRFEELVHAYETSEYLADVNDEAEHVLEAVADELLTPYDDPYDERWRLEFGLCDEEEEKELARKYYLGGTCAEK